MFKIRCFQLFAVDCICFADNCTSTGVLTDGTMHEDVSDLSPSVCQDFAPNIRLQTFLFLCVLLHNIYLNSFVIMCQIAVTNNMGIITVTMETQLAFDW